LCGAELGADTAQSLLKLGYLYSTQGKYKEAVELYEQSLAVFDHLFGSGHPEVVRTFSLSLSLSISLK
jgi:tetratricopeptide (TPR) repeat protein